MGVIHCNLVHFLYLRLKFLIFSTIIVNNRETILSLTWNAEGLKSSIFALKIGKDVSPWNLSQKMQQYSTDRQR